MPEDCPPAELTFKKYQELAATTAIYPRKAAVLYPVLGFLGEAGEMAEKALKGIFHDGKPQGWDERNAWLRSLYVTLENLIAAAKSCEVLKKLIRDKTAELPLGVLDEIEARVLTMTDEQREGFLKEVADGFWYSSAICGDINDSMARIAQGNLDKLFARKAKGCLGGSGDTREQQ